MYYIFAGVIIHAKDPSVKPMSVIIISRKVLHVDSIDLLFLPFYAIYCDSRQFLQAIFHHTKKSRLSDSICDWNLQRKSKLKPIASWLYDVVELYEAEEVWELESRVLALVFDITLDHT